MSIRLDIHLRPAKEFVLDSTGFPLAPLEKKEQPSKSVLLKLIM